MIGGDFMQREAETCSIDTERRRRWLGLFAKARLSALEATWEALEEKPEYRFIRPPETGMVMVRARAGGVGRRFNAGEMTLSRCVVQLDDGTTGYGYTSSRHGRHAELAAIFDALLQDSDRRNRLEPILVAPLQEAEVARRAARAERAAATRVEFFTMVRGDD